MTRKGAYQSAARSLLPPAPLVRVDGRQPCARYPEPFFPAEPGDDGYNARRAEADALYAKTLCGFCDFAADCLAYALSVHERGIWGGTDEADRERIRRQAGVRANHPTPPRTPQAEARARYRREQEQRARRRAAEAAAAQGAAIPLTEAS